MRKIERKYPHDLVVVGVHSAKFTAEQSTEAVRQAVIRHSVGHPVVNDSDFRVWQAYAVRAWPTLIFLDPQGGVIGRHEGEFPLEPMDQLVEKLLAQYEAAGQLDHQPLSFTPEMEREPARPLFFPGKILAHAAGDRLYIADSGHHRVLEATLDGRLLRVFGSGEDGFEDGPPERARFSGPQGLSLQGEALYVADTENHAVRRIDLSGGQIETVAGDGRQARGYGAGGPAREVSLSSPWDVLARDGRLYVAMAGLHQIWRVDLERQVAVPWAGSGREGIVDGLLPSAELAQPSGLATDGERLYVADSEVSGVRAIDFNQTGRVQTIVGQGLFEFGDVDGVGEQVRLQHPLGIASGDAELFVADTYNHRIKRLYPRTATAQSMFGSAQPGLQDGSSAEACFSEPSGLSFADGRLYIADTNNHAVRIADLAKGEVSTLEIR